MSLTYIHKFWFSCITQTKIKLHEFNFQLNYLIKNFFKYLSMKMSNAVFVYFFFKIINKLFISECYLHTLGCVGEEIKWFKISFSSVHVWVWKCVWNKKGEFLFYLKNQYERICKHLPFIFLTVLKVSVFKQS